MSEYKPPTMVQPDAPDWTLTFGNTGLGQDNAWITVDELWAVNIIRTDEGIVIDVYPNNDKAGTEWVATLASLEAEVLPEPKDCFICGGPTAEEDGVAYCIAECQEGNE